MFPSRKTHRVWRYHKGIYQITYAAIRLAVRIIATNIRFGYTHTTRHSSISDQNLPLHPIISISLGNTRLILWHFRDYRSHMQSTIDGRIYLRRVFCRVRRSTSSWRRVFVAFSKTTAKYDGHHDYY